MGRLEKLEAGKGRKMTEEEERLLASALNVSRVELRGLGFAGCSELDIDEDEVLRHHED